MSTAEEDPRHVLDLTGKDVSRNPEIVWLTTYLLLCRCKVQPLEDPVNVHKGKQAIKSAIVQSLAQRSMCRGGGYERCATCFVNALLRLELLQGVFRFLRRRGIGPMRRA